MKNVFKRFSYILLSCYMVFCPVASASIHVQAFEWVDPSLSFAESLGYLLSLLGIAYVGDKATNWEGWNNSGVASDYADEFQQYALEHGLNYEETTSWMDEVGNGRLNQASQVWEKFKAWALSLVGSNNSVVISSSPVDYIGLLNMINYICDTNFSSISNSAADITDLSSTTFYSFYMTKFYSSSYGDYVYSFNVFINEGVYSLSDTAYVLCNNNSIPHNLSISITPNIKSLRITQNNTIGNRLSTSDENYLWNIPINTNLPSSYKQFEISASDDSDSVFVSLSPESIEDFSLVLQTAISDSIPDVIPLPWDNVGDNTQAINDKMDELLELVSSGALSIDEFMEAVQTLLGVFTVDTTADDVLIPEKPNPDSDEPQKLEDEVAKNKSNSGFMLAGLEKVFPFCIPFDLYAFMTLLVADPVAPVIEYPIYNPVTDDNEIITIDFSTWESVVVIFRYIFDFLFIIGLLLIARALIGEGSDA